MKTVEQIDGFAQRGWIKTYAPGARPASYHRITARDRALYANAKVSRYLVGGSFELSDLWFWYCEARGWPYIVVRPRRKFSAITVDFIAVPATLRQQGISDRVFEMLRAREPALPRDVGVSGGDVMFIVDRVPRDITMQVASEVADRCIEICA